MALPDRPKRRMLLVASIGVATVSYALAACEKQQVGNLAMPPEQPTSTPVAGNLTAPPPAPDAAPPPAPATAASDNPSLDNPHVTSGNLMAPPSPQPSPKPKPSSSTGPVSPPKPPPHAGNLMAPPPRK